jgi:IMP dehydrogenase
VLAITLRRVECRLAMREYTFTKYQLYRIHAWDEDRHSILLTLHTFLFVSSLCGTSLADMSQEIEIGLGKKGRMAYSLDDVAIVPSRRTRDPEDVSTSWQVDAYEFDIPVMSAPMDSVTSPATAIAMGKLGALGVLDLEGIWTRYEDPEPLLEEISSLPAKQVTARLQEIYAAPIQPELITQRLHEIRNAGVTVAAALSPQRTPEFTSTVISAGVDLFVIRGTAVSAEHVSEDHEPLNLKKFIYDLDVPVIVGGAANYTAALHLMRTGAAGVLVGFGGGAVSATRDTIGVEAPMATAIADVTEARRDYMDESGGRYVQLIADGGMGTSGSFVKALAMGADAVMLGAPLARSTQAPGRGKHWGAEAHHPTLPRGFRSDVGTVGSLRQILFGPSHEADGTTNFIGALRRAMASTGYVDVKNFQRCPVAVSPHEYR